MVQPMLLAKEDSAAAERRLSGKYFFEQRARFAAEFPELIDDFDACVERRDRTVELALEGLGGKPLGNLNEHVFLIDWEARRMG